MTAFLREISASRRVILARRSLYSRVVRVMWDIFVVGGGVEEGCVGPGGKAGGGGEGCDFWGGEVSRA